jgi:AraC-like DNA-binding protein
MPRSRQMAAPPGRVIPALFRYLRTRGVDVAPLVRRFNLPSDVEALQELAVTPADFDPILQAAGKELADPFIALHLPAVLTWQDYPMAELAARSCATVGEALGRVVRFGSAFFARLVFGLEERGDEVEFTHSVRGGPPRGRRHGDEYALASVLTHMRRWAGVEIVARRVRFMHASRGDLAELYRFFGTDDVDFGCTENALVFDVSVMRLPLATRDPRLLATAESLAERELSERPPVPAFAQTVAVHVRKELADGSPTASSVARRMRMSMRTMQRRLDEEGTTFRRVLEGVRRDLARAYARDASIPLSEVARRLGFCDLPTFTRAFRRWTGQAPGAFRAHAR